MPELIVNNPPEAPIEAQHSSPPYEAALNTALKKLTSEVLIFLLAYTILLIGVAVFGAELTTQLRTLLYVIPIIGVAAFIWLSQSRLADQAGRDVEVVSRIATGGSEVIGERGIVRGGRGKTKVRSILTREGSIIVGREGGTSSDRQPQAAQPASASYLVEIYEQLDPNAQNRLMSTALSLRRKQQEPDV